MLHLNHSSSHESLEWLMQFLHFIRLHQMVYQLTLVTIILFFSPSATLFQIFSAFVMIVLITPSFLLMQDILGKKDDEKFGQKRILFSDRVNKIFFFSSITFMVVLLFLNNLISLLWYIMLFVSTLSYAATKHFHKMFLTYSFRFLSSIFTFLLYLYIIVGGLFEQFLFLLSFISVLDLVGNMAGDIRDGQKDTVAGVKTLLTTSGRAYTLEIMDFLVICIFGLLTIKYKSIVFILLLVVNISPFLLIDQLSIRLSHAIFHLLKLINFLFVALALASIDILFFFAILSFIVLAWLFSYYFYLFNSTHRIHESNIS